MRETITVFSKNRMFTIEITEKAHLSIKFFELYIARKIFKGKFYRDLRGCKVRCETIKDIIQIYRNNSMKERVNPNLSLRDLIGHLGKSISIHIMTEEEFKSSLLPPH